MESVCTREETRESLLMDRAFVYSFVLARQRAKWKAKKYIRRVCRGRFIRNRSVAFLGTLGTRSPHRLKKDRWPGCSGGWALMRLRSLSDVADVSCAMTSTRSFVIARRRHGGCMIYFRFPPFAPFVSCRRFPRHWLAPYVGFNFTREPLTRAFLTSSKFLKFYDTKTKVRLKPPTTFFRVV